MMLVVIVVMVAAFVLMFCFVLGHLHLTTMEREREQTSIINCVLLRL